MGAVTMLAVVAVVVGVLVGESSGLYFYLHGSGAEKCFLEDLPKDTLLVGTYRSEQYDARTNTYAENPSMGLKVFVNELPDYHRVKDMSTASSGRFSFTALNTATYQVCISSNSSSWFSQQRTRVHIDMVVGDGSDLSERTNEKVNDMARMVRDLSHRVNDIRREQTNQRQREMGFRDLSEAVNSKAVWYVFMQIIVLGFTCLWQLRHLKGFFEAKKLV